MSARPSRRLARPGTNEIDDAWTVRTDSSFAHPNLVGARLTYPGSATALVEFGWLTAALPRCELSVLAADAYSGARRVTFDLTLTVAGTTRTFTDDLPRAVRCFDRQLAAFVNLVRGRTARAVPGCAEGLASLRTSERVAELAEKQRRTAGGDRTEAGRP